MVVKRGEEWLGCPAMAMQRHWLHEEGHAEHFDMLRFLAMLPGSQIDQIYGHPSHSHHHASVSEEVCSKKLRENEKIAVNFFLGPAPKLMANS